MKTLVVSDLHVGPDHVVPIYAGSEALPALIAAHAKSPLRVILNGDTFDLLLDDAPLTLSPQSAAERLAKCATSEDGAPLIQCLAHVLSNGGEVLVRAGNHDLELALPEVQTALTEMIRAVGGPTACLQFANDDLPFVFEAGGQRVLVTHGEHDDPFNKWTRRELASADFTYPPGSALVKTIINRLKPDLRFLDLLKPDFHGAVLAALAVAPDAARVVFESTGAIDIIAEAISRRADGPAFANDKLTGYDDVLAQADFDDDEVTELLGILDGTCAFAGDGPGVVSRALAKLARAALRVYARLYRLAAADAGQRFFDEEPTDEEWREAQRLAEQAQASIVVTGHTHARRKGVRGKLTYVNTGTWIALLQLPSPAADVTEWEAYLDELRADRHLDTSPHPVLLGAACLIEPANGAATVELIRLQQAPPYRWRARGRASRTSGC